MKVITKEELKDFFNTPRQRDIQAQTAKIKQECGEIQADREARLMAEHNYDDCELDYCWICEQRAYERGEGLR
jgi:hypothetical protein